VKIFGMFVLLMLTCCLVVCTLLPSPQLYLFLDGCKENEFTPDRLLAQTHYYRPNFNKSRLVADSLKNFLTYIDALYY